MKNRTRSSALNLAFGTFNQAVSMFLNFLSRTFFIQILGARYLGINGLFADILMLLSLAELGLRTSMSYTFYKPLAENDFAKVAMLTQFYKKVYHTIALFVTVVGISLVPFLDFLVNLDDSIPYLKIYYLFFLADIVASYFFIYKTSVIEADQKKYVITQYQMIVNIAKIILQISILLITHNYFLYLAVQVLSTIINNLIVSWKASQLYPMINGEHEKLGKAERMSIFANMRSMFIFKVSTTIMKGTDNILMSVMFGTIWVGIYSNYHLVILSLENFVSVIFLSITASIGNIIAMEKPQKRFEIFQMTKTVALILATFSTVCLYLLLDDFIYVWLGNEYTISSWFFGAIILNFYFRMVGYPILAFRQATGLYLQTRYIMLVAAVLNLVLSVIMGHFLGISGILYASALSQLATYFWYEPKLLFKQFFERGTKKYFLSIFANAVGTVILIGGLQFLMKGYPVETWLAFLLKAIVVAILTALIVLIAYFPTEEFKLLMKKLLYVTKKKKRLKTPA